MFVNVNNPGLEFSRLLTFESWSWDALKPYLVLVLFLKLSILDFNFVSDLKDPSLQQSHQSVVMFVTLQWWKKTINLVIERENCSLVWNLLPYFRQHRTSARSLALMAKRLIQMLVCALITS